MFFKPKNSRFIQHYFSSKSGAGFTLIDMLVTISITLILSGILIGYGKESGKQLLLINNQAKLVSLISRAKSLSTTTFIENSLPITTGGPERICGYGIHADQGKGEVFIFKDRPDPQSIDCATSDNKFSSGDEKLSEQLDVLNLASQAVKFAPESDLIDILFIPPDPTIVINGDKSMQAKEATLVIETKDKSSKVVVKVNNAGRIWAPAK